MLLFTLFSLYNSNIDLVCSMFFFQAEDGIRDLVRSRGLGDVYKRQTLQEAIIEGMSEAFKGIRKAPKPANWDEVVRKFGVPPSGGSAHSVSYTHLTLPTSDLV